MQGLAAMMGRSVHTNCSIRKKNHSFIVILNYILMPGPSTSPKIVCAGPNFLRQTKIYLDIVPIPSFLCKTNALSFYRSQNVLGWSKFFVPHQKFIYILWQSQTFCARQKDDLHSVKLVFVPAQRFLKRH